MKIRFSESSPNSSNSPAGLISDIASSKPHGRETWVEYYGQGFVVKRPLTDFGEEKRIKWLQKQHLTRKHIEEILWYKGLNYSVSYDVPEMKHVNDEEVAVLEERAPGERLTKQFYDSLSARRQTKIQNGIAEFLSDMAQLRPVKESRQKLSERFNFAQLDKFLSTRGGLWLDQEDIKFTKKVAEQVSKFEYDTTLVWAHRDLNPGNILYDLDTWKLSFIDFAEANYDCVYHDIFYSALNNELGISAKIFNKFLKLYGKKQPNLAIDPVQTAKIAYMNGALRVLRRLNYIGKRARPNPANEKSQKNQNLMKSWAKEEVEKLKAASL
ncbi:MAG: phosphotransferase [Alphaproteobacteria bacterium]|nr:phosphotransferase [Alphaproteobacteria bacterium]